MSFGDPIVIFSSLVGKGTSTTSVSLLLSLQENNRKNEAKMLKQFGSGWVWLVVDRYGKLQVTTTENQDNPLMKNALIPGTPILGIDLWEHAYYLDYQNRKGSYIDAFYDHINWEKVNENYIDALKKVKKV